MEVIYVINIKLPGKKYNVKSVRMPVLKTESTKKTVNLKGDPDYSNNSNTKQDRVQAAEKSRKRYAAFCL